ncbi:hypothetical protein GCM10009127_16410 [Alteraurantiacibacter aestuarii]
MPRKKKPKISKEERFRRRHYTSGRAVFRNIGFERIGSLSDREFTYDGSTGDFDDIYVGDNVVILIEHTISAMGKVGDHLKKKHILFQKIASDPLKFFDFLVSKSKEFADAVSTSYHRDNFIIRIVYNTVNPPSSVTKANVPEPIYMEYPNLKYFEKITGIAKLSTKKEVLQFLGIDPDDVGVNGAFPKKGASDPYDGSILPEASSGFPKGFKVVSFYADPASLLERAYVVRRDGWRGSSESYQRMLQKGKVEQIRKKLRTEKTVFINNLVATLPDNVHPVDEHGKTVDISKLTKTSPVKIGLPRSPNSLGVIDGQHRLYSYYVAKDDDPIIAGLRNNQNLLVTAVIFPGNLSTAERERFEAGMFLNINSNQTNAPKALRQEIQTILKPFGNEAIAKKVMQRLADEGPLEGHVERFFYEQGLLKTTSIVSYGLAPLVKLSGTDSLFAKLTSETQERLLDHDEAALEDYVEFCKSAINEVLAAFKSQIGNARWVTDRNVPERVLTVTYINSFLILMRILIENGQSTSGSVVRAKLGDIGKFKFKDYHSSQYNRMAQDIFARYF